MNTMRQALVVGLLMTLAQPASAQFNPSRQITIVVPIGAGGGVDATGRLIAEKLQERLKQPVVVENRPAAGGMVGTDSVAKAAPDGHTILLMETSSVLHKWLHTNVPYDVVADFAPIARVATSPLILYASPTFAPNNVRELIALAKAHPGKLNFASSGKGSTSHVAGELFKIMAGIDIVHVPYRGSAPALTDLLGGQVQIVFDNITSSIPHIQTGELRALAVTSSVRSPVLPDLPSLGDFVPGFEVSAWAGVGAPKGTPAEIVERRNREINAGLADARIKTRFAELGGAIFAGTPADFGKHVAEETEKWGRVIRAANIEVE
jgi:tripartite-type tricarboxylate transporter receptor subunit TctC